MSSRSRSSSSGRTTARAAGKPIFTRHDDFAFGHLYSDEEGGEEGGEGGEEKDEGRGGRGRAKTGGMETGGTKPGGVQSGAVHGEEEGRRIHI